MILAGYMVPHPPIAVPEIGKGEERKIQDTLDSFAEVARDIARIKPETIILISPHSVMYRDYFHISPGNGADGSFWQFRAEQVRFSVKYDQALAGRIASEKRTCSELRLSGGDAGRAGQQSGSRDDGASLFYQ